MNNGNLRDLITIRRQVNTKNPVTGGLERSWETLPSNGQVWAEIKSLNGREAVIGSVLQGVSHFQITIRYRTDINVSDQIKWGARELNVHTAEDREGKRRWTVIHASTQAPQGA